MKTIVIASQKGGSAKTTCTAHLAVMAQIAGHGPTAILDTDPQETLSTWWNIREADNPPLITSSLAGLPAALQQAEQAGVRYCFVDTPPALGDRTREVLKVADLVIIPTRPSPSDLWALGHTLDMVKATGVPYVFVLTQAKGNARITLQTVAALSEHGPVAQAVLHDRVEYATAMIDGRTVQEVSPSGSAAREVEELWISINKRFSDNAKSRKREMRIVNG